MDATEKMEDNLLIFICFLLLILTVLTFSRNAELEKENYNLNQQMIELRFHQRMISETQETSKNQKIIIAN